jgi:predicted dienelactone hydrolase
MVSNFSGFKARCLRIAFSAFSAVLLGSAGVAHASVGLSEIAATAEDGPVTVYYPAEAAAQPVTRGALTLSVAAQATPQRGNGRLVVVSHGTGGSPWVHADLARALVEAGYVVALPEHRADNYKDHSDAPGALSRRPGEVSRAIDALGRDARFAPLLDLSQVGVYGMSAGGHTALTIAGGRWSPAGFKRHCEQNLVEDFQFCVGVITKLTGGWLDGFKKWVALTVIRYQFGDTTVREYNDPRVAAVVAAVPAAAVFDMASFAAPRVPLGLVTAQQDKWLVPRFHSDRVLQVCQACEHIADVSNGGHGAFLSPLPPGLTGLLGDMLNDPPGFDRSVMPEVDRKITAFFSQHLLQPSTRRDHTAEVKPRPAP